jgi:hypothetical protein
MHGRHRDTATSGAPVVSSITVTQNGNTLTATVDYVPGSSATSQTFTGTATDSATGLTGSMQVTFAVTKTDTTTVGVSDSGSRQWTPVSDTGTVAVFTAPV